MKRPVKFFDPVPVLRNLRALELDLAYAKVDPDLLSLRRGALKPEREARLAAIFALGVSNVLRRPVLVAPDEAQDFDFLIAIDPDHEADPVVPVQLKELAPEELNSAQTLDGLLGRVKKKYPATATVLAVHFNRAQRFDCAAWSNIESPFAEVWFFGAMDPEHHRWFICGDAKSTPQGIAFDYPEPDGWTPTPGTV